MAKKKAMQNNVNHDENGDFVKGHTAGFTTHPENINRKGRPQRPSLTRLLNKMLEDGANGRTGEEIMAELLEASIEHAKDGNAAYMKEIWSRIDGKVADRLAGHDGGPITFDDEARERIRKMVEAADHIPDDSKEQ